MFSFSLNAQICDPPCTPDQSCIANSVQAGYLCSGSNEPMVEIADVYYEETITFRPPEGDYYNPYAAIRLDAITNLPDGMTWCKSQDIFYVTEPTTYYCVQLKGTPTTPGRYVLSLTTTLFADNNGTLQPLEQYTDTPLVVIVLPSDVEVPVADFIWTGGQCRGDTIVFTDISPVGSNCVWKVDGYVVNEGSSIFSYVFPPVYSPTNFSVSLSVSTEYLTSETTQNITIYPPPFVNISYSNDVVCHGESVTLTASGAETYLWSNEETSAEITVTMYESTVFTVIGTDINSCVNKDSLTVYVMPNDTIIVYDEFCEGDVYEFYGNNFTEEGIYYIDIISPSTNCEGVVQLELTVKPKPQQVVVLQDPENGILPLGTSGSITLETSEVGIGYFVTIGGEPITDLISGTGSSLSLGDNYPAGSYDVMSYNQYDCYLVQGTVNFTTPASSNTGKIVANVSFGTPPSSFPTNHVKVKLYKAAIDIANNEVIVLMDQQLLDANGQAVFAGLVSGDYYLGSFVQYPENYNVAEHVYYQDAVVHEDAISIPIEEGTVFFASLHHVLLTESQGSNTMQGIVGASSNNSKGLNPIEDMVVILKNSDINEIIGVSVTSDNGQYYFDNIPDNANIQAFVTNLSCQNYIAFETQTTSDQIYNVNFIVTETSIYPNDITMLEDMQIQNIEFTVFPNPAKEVLGINCDVEKAILKIFDINGRLIYTDLAFPNIEINISELVSGTYIIILSAENGKTGVQKFVKE